MRKSISWILAFGITVVAALYEHPKFSHFELIVTMALCYFVFNDLSKNKR